MKAALIGAGQIARQHLACIKEMQGVEVVGVCDLSPAVAQCAAERHVVSAWYTDHKVMLEDTRPDVVHVTTPPTSHFRLAMDSLEAGAHVIVEKPATSTLAELVQLAEKATACRRALVEDHNYVFSAATRKIKRLIDTGEFGAVVHIDVLICLDILGANGFADPNTKHPALSLAGGAIADFLPHLASLTHAFIGPHRDAQVVWKKRKGSVLPYDEFHALVDAQRGTATLGFSASAQPDAFWVRVYGEKMQATTNLFETRLTVDRVRGGPKPLRPFLNGLTEAKAVRRAAVDTLLRKFKAGPGAYDGMWDLVTCAYKALRDGSPLPVTLNEVMAVNRLVDDLKPKDLGV